MPQTLLDTNFILTCIKQKIDFFEELGFKGLEILIPKQVITELEELSKQSLRAKLALKMLKTGKFTTIDLKSKNVDQGIITYSKANPRTIIATLDQEIKKKTRNSKLVIMGRKKLEIL